MFSFQNCSRVSTFHFWVRQPDLSSALCVSVGHKWRRRVCPASVTHLSRRNVPLISTSSRRLSDSRRAGVKCATGGGSEATGSHGFERLPGCLMEGWTSAERRRRRYHVPTRQERREQSSCEASGHSLPSCRVWEEQNISCYQVCPVGTQPAEHYGMAVGVRHWLHHVWKSRSDFIPLQEFRLLFLALSICDSDQNSQILAHFLQCNSCRIIIQMETFCVLPCICSLLHSSNNSQWSVLAVRHRQP